jgi:hypothetical protein
MSAESTSSVLASLMVAERACCLRLLPLLDAERAAAAAYDHAALLACLHEREILQVEWQRAMGRRKEHLAAAGRSLAELVAGDAELAREVRDTAREAESVRRAQQVNEGVVRAALAHVTDLLSVMRRERSDSRYDGRAAITGEALSSAGGRWSA